MGTKNDGDKPRMLLLAPTMMAEMHHDGLMALTRWYHRVPGVSAKNVFFAIAKALPSDVVMFQVLQGVVRVLEFGAKKYAAWNWIQGMSFDRLAQACARHLMAGDCLDAESGLPHIYHALCEAMFLMEFEANPGIYSKWDDRPTVLSARVSSHLEGDMLLAPEPDSPDPLETDGLGPR